MLFQSGSETNQNIKNGLTKTNQRGTQEAAMDRYILWFFGQKGNGRTRLSKEQDDLGEGSGV